MLDPATTAVITGAAGNMIAYMLNGRMDALRERLGRIFGIGDQQERSSLLRALEDDASALASRDLTEADLKGRWAIILTDYLTKHPEARTGLEEMASSELSMTGSMNVGAQHNHGAGTFIGRDNYGSVHAPRMS